MNLRTAVAANFIGNTYRSALAFFFVPIYLHYLGVEAYGLVGFSTTLIAFLTFLDAGLSRTVNREMAHLSANLPANRRDICHILAASTALFSILAILTAGVIWVGAPSIADLWLNLKTLDRSETIIAIRLIGFVLGEQLFVGLFQSAMMGLHRQEMANAILALTSTVRCIGTYFVLKYLSATPSAFFLFYSLVLLAQIAALRIFLQRYIGKENWFQRPRKSHILQMLHMTKGFGAVALLAFILGQVDKLLVSRLISLQDFGYYMVAVSISVTPLAIISPVTSAYFPKLAVLAKTSARDLFHVFHAMTQFSAALAAPFGWAFVFLSPQILLAWTGDRSVTAHIAPLAAPLGAGYALNAAMQTCISFELAHARTRIIIKVYLALVALLIPGLLAMATFYGSVGAAWSWLLLNIGQLIAGIPFILHKMPRDDLFGLYLNDLLPSCCIAGLVTGVAKLALPDSLTRADAGVAVVVIIGLCTIASCLAASHVRGYAVRKLHILHR
jgi:O-antigen/teichoic acid export membrane protein